MHAGFLVAFLVLGARFIAQVPIAALAGVTAWTGARLLEWSTWRRLPHMRRVDAAAFISTAFAVLLVNAVAAVAIGCSFYVLREISKKLSVATGWQLPCAFQSPQLCSTLAPPRLAAVGRRGAAQGCSDAPDPVGSQHSENSK
jgi:hypothetical protein